MQADALCRINSIGIKLDHFLVGEGRVGQGTNFTRIMK